MVETYPMSVPASEVKRLLDYVNVVEHEETFTSELSSTEIDRLLKYVQYLEQSNSSPVGIEWDTASTSPTLKRIDINGNEITPSIDFFDNHALFGKIRRCSRDRTTGIITYGSNNAGAGLDLSPTNSDILVEYPTARIKYQVDGTKRRLWVIPYTEEDTYTIHPSAVQRGGGAHSKIYLGAFESGIRVTNAGAICLKTISGVQPFTGGGFKALAYTSGSDEFNNGETLTGTTSGATGVVVAYSITSGTFAGGDAAGNVYLAQCSTTAFTAAETLNGTSSGTNCATASGAATSVPLTIGNAETYANNIGSGFGIMNVWTYAYIQLLMYIEFGTFDIQFALGRGAVDIAQGTGYNGLKTGADSINSNLAENGTGIGSGLYGETPVTWRGLENPYGNISKFIIGLNMYLASGTDSEGKPYTAGSYRILNRSGSGTPAAVLTYGSYETGEGVPITADGFISAILSDELGALAFIPSANTGSSSTYLCDFMTIPTGANRIVPRGGHWYRGSYCGPGYLNPVYDTTTSSVVTGARIEYIPQA